MGDLVKVSFAIFLGMNLLFERPRGESATVRRDFTHSLGFNQHEKATELILFWSPEFDQLVVKTQIDTKLESQGVTVHLGIFNSR